MIKLNSIYFEHLVVCLTENYHPASDKFMNTTELATIHFGGKEFMVITAEEADVADLMTMIDEPISTETSAALMYQIAKEEIHSVTKNFLRDLLAGDRSSGESLMDFYNTPEPAFDREVWAHAAAEVKRELLECLA